MELIIGFILGMVTTYGIFGVYQYLLSKYEP